MTRPLTRAEVAALSEDLRQMLDRVQGGDLDATTAMRYRIEGALAVIEVIQGHSGQFVPE
jgi:hypothetical protein